MRIIFNPLKSTIIALLLIFGILCFSFGAEISLTGTYQGKNIFVQNPFVIDTEEYCTDAVYVNGKLVLTKPQVSAFEIDLSTYPINSSIEIRIVYKDGCGPNIVNPQALKFDTDFKFLICQATPSELKWITERESVPGIYTIERLDDESWISVAEVDSKGNELNNFYKLPARHKEGVNVYRIKFTQAEGLTLYSKEIEFNAVSLNP